MNKSHSHIRTLVVLRIFHKDFVIFIYILNSEQKSGIAGNVSILGIQVCICTSKYPLIAFAMGQYIDAIHIDCVHLETDNRNVLVCICAVCSKLSLKRRI